MTLTKAMWRELRAIHTTGEPSSPYDLTHIPGGLWFACRDRSIGALERRGLIEAAPDWQLTDAGRAMLTGLPARSD